MAAALETEAEAKNWPEDAVRYRAMKERRGSVDFRARLLEAYGRRCCISGFRVEALLEAAHIRPHAEEPNYDSLGRMPLPVAASIGQSKPGTWGSIFGVNTSVHGAWRVGGGHAMQHGINAKFASVVDYEISGAKC